MTRAAFVTVTFHRSVTLPFQFSHQFFVPFVWLLYYIRNVFGRGGGTRPKSRVDASGVLSGFRESRVPGCVAAPPLWLYADW